MPAKDHEMNEAAFRGLEVTINATYPNGHFVALIGGQIVADADDFDVLHRLLKEAGRNPRQAFIVQAGHVYPEKAVIFFHG